MDPFPQGGKKGPERLPRTSGLCGPPGLGDCGPETPGSLEGSAHLSVPNRSPVTPIISHQCTLPSMSAVQVYLPISHTPAPPTGYMSHNLHLTCLKLPATHCHRNLYDIADALLCDSAWAISAPPTVSFVHTEVGLKARETRFTRPNDYSPSFRPKLFWKLRLPPEPSVLMRISRPLQLGPVPGLVFHIPEPGGSQPGSVVLAARWGL